MLGCRGWFVGVPWWLALPVLFVYVCVIAVVLVVVVLFACCQLLALFVGWAWRERHARAVPVVPERPEPQTRWSNRR